MSKLLGTVTFQLDGPVDPLSERILRRTLARWGEAHGGVEWMYTVFVHKNPLLIHLRAYNCVIDSNELDSGGHLYIGPYKAQFLAKDRR
jgi:hypothetical protein